MNISQSIDALCRQAAEPYGVASNVHPEDFMFRHIVDRAESKGSSLEEAVSEYFSSGRECAARFAQLVHAELGYSPEHPLAVLEFASGYGRVTRHLPQLFPNAFIVATDVHEEAARFADERLNIASVVSSAAPENLKIPQAFDVIFALSFFTHIPHATFGRWIKSLHDHLKPGGFLLFTTSSRKPWVLAGRDPELIEKHDALFINTSEQHDLDPREYGLMFARPGYVIQQIYAYTQAPVVRYEENFWWGLQDLWVVTRPG